MSKFGLAIATINAASLRKAAPICNLLGIALEFDGGYEHHVMKTIWRTVTEGVPLVQVVEDVVTVLETIPKRRTS